MSGLQSQREASFGYPRSSTIDKMRASLNKLPRHMALSPLSFRAILFTPRICCQSRTPPTLNLATLIRENRTAGINVFRESRFKYPLFSNGMKSALIFRKEQWKLTCAFLNGRHGLKRARDRIILYLISYKLLYICICTCMSVWTIIYVYMYVQVEKVARKDCHGTELTFV